MLCQMVMSSGYFGYIRFSAKLEFLMTLVIFTDMKVRIKSLYGSTSMYIHLDGYKFLMQPFLVRCGLKQ